MRFPRTQLLGLLFGADARFRLIALVGLIGFLSMPAAIQAVEPSSVKSMVAIPSPATPSKWESVSVPIALCSTPPVIDGRIDDACWKTATHVAGFYRFAGTAAITDGNQTEAWICADKAHLYLAFHCLSSQPVRGSETVRNGDVSHDDYVGIDIDSQDTRRAFSTFLVNARGTQYQVLEGGTADNITWAGDWTAAARETPDGYTVEMAIPFGLMRYPRGSKSFGLLLYRQVHGETALEGWPYVPLNGANNQNEASYMAQTANLAPNFYAPRPIFLPYALASAGEGSSVRTGLDIKAPISTTLTGVASLNPDFETIEQDIATINFSYTPKLLTDKRPFFAEGAGFLPDNDLFYSRQIGQIDAGLKLAGKQQNTTVGLLSTTSSGQEGENTFALNLRQDLGSLSDVGLELTDDNQHDMPANGVGRVFGGLGWKAGSDNYTLSAFHTQSYVGGQQAGGSDSIGFANTQGQVNRPFFSLKWLDIAPNFVSDLGYVPEVDKRGGQISVGQTTIYRSGKLALSNIELDADDFQHHTAGFFHSDTSLTLYSQTTAGWSFLAAPAIGQREQFHDATGAFQVGWGHNTLFQQGFVEEAFGHQENQRYNFLEVQQGLLISRPCNLEIDFSRLLLGSTITTQTILTGAYRITRAQTIGGRVVEQGPNTDIYLSFGQQVRSGSDIFVLFGDPNSPNTRGRIAVKIVQPL
jgi:hypothetical protein